MIKVTKKLKYGDRVIHTPSGRHGEIEGFDYIGSKYETVLVFFDNGEALHALPANIIKEKK